MSPQTDPNPRGRRRDAPPAVRGGAMDPGRHDRADKAASPGPSPSRRGPKPPRPRTRTSEPLPAEEPRRSAARGRKAGRDKDPVHLFEAVYFYIYDVGRSINQKSVAALIPAHDDLGLVKRRDTPASLSLPRPLVVRLNEEAALDRGVFESFSAQAKIYEDGAVSVIIRAKARIRLSELHALHDKDLPNGEETVTLDGYADESFARLFAAIKPAVDDPWEDKAFDRETYAVFCLIDGEEDPASYLAEHRPEIAALLIGESPTEVLHDSQVNATLGRPFSYRKDDLAVFDMDRCFIVDARRDYEDLLLIVENANYQLLELRVLDKLLDRWLDEAEEDMRVLYTTGSRGRMRRIGGSIQEKFAHIQALRFDALFILENLENSSKIIGDYYLGQIYDRLCAIFNTEGWKWSVERRLETLQSIYDMVKTDTSERKLLFMEVIFIIVCIIFPIIQIYQSWLLSRQ